ncbi:MAG: dienelactone hydrolase family protein [Verrucomicrobiia bacterium]
MKVFTLFQTAKFASGITLVLLFLGSLFWAKEQDPFSRQWFTLKTTNHNSFKCVAVLPKPMRKYPVIVYVHGWNGNLMNDGNDLRQMAELGLAVVSIEYDQINEAAFEPQFETLLRHLGGQRWADTNAIAWVGFSMGANRLLDFAEHHPEQLPQLLVLIGGAGLPEGETNGLLKNLCCPTLLIHGEQDEVFPIADTRRLASALQTNGGPVGLQIIPGATHGMEPERGVIFRNIGECCLSRLMGKDCWQHYYSIARWQAAASPLWLFWLPAAVWIVGWFAWRRYRKPVLSEKIKLKRHEIALRWLAVLLAILALAETAIHLATPYFPVNDRTLYITRRFLIQPKERADSEFLASQPIWQGEKLQTLLNHVELAGYNRELINWQVDDKIYQDFVLSPVITGSSGEQLDWRRPLWEEFYPRIRHESSPEDAAKIAVRHLRERVTIAAAPNLPHEVPTVWLRQVTDETGFEIIYVAALRSVGVPARLDSNSQAEFWNGNKWQIAPQPSVVSWCF